MKYMGSKARVAKHILPIILKDRKPDQPYVEPMVGGANSIDKVDGIRIGGELNEYIAEMWIAFFLSLLLAPLFFGINGVETDTFQNVNVVLCFTLLAIVRGYIVRRVFNKIQALRGKG